MLSQDRLSEPSENVQVRVETARQRQRRRFEGTDGIADLAGAAQIGQAHLAEALQSA